MAAEDLLDRRRLAAPPEGPLSLQPAVQARCRVVFGPAGCVLGLVVWTATRPAPTRRPPLSQQTCQLFGRRYAVALLQLRQQLQRLRQIGGQILHVPSAQRHQLERHEHVVQLQFHDSLFLPDAAEVEVVVAGEEVVEVVAQERVSHGSRRRGRRGRLRASRFQVRRPHPRSFCAWRNALCVLCSARVWGASRVRVRRGSPDPAGPLTDRSPPWIRCPLRPAVGCFGAVGDLPRASRVS